MTELHLGCGDNIKEGFLNIDMRNDLKHPNFMGWDLSLGLPPLTGMDITGVHSEHFWEHLTATEGRKLMLSCRDRLVRGGKFRIALPDFRKLATAYVNNDWSFFTDPGVLSFAPNHQMLEVINYALYQRQADGFAEHKMMYDLPYMLFLLGYLGFKNPREDSFNPLYHLEGRRPYTFYAIAEAP